MFGQFPAGDAGIGLRGPGTAAQIGRLQETLAVV
jgi:hypothetical protein